MSWVFSSTFLPMIIYLFVKKANVSTRNNYNPTELTGLLVNFEVTNTQCQLRSVCVCVGGGWTMFKSLLLHIDTPHTLKHLNHCTLVTSLKVFLSLELTQNLLFTLTGANLYNKYSISDYMYICFHEFIKKNLKNLTNCSFLRWYLLIHILYLWHVEFFKPSEPRFSFESVVLWLLKVIWMQLRTVIHISWLNLF